jgi:hypothetical protein
VSNEPASVPELNLADALQRGIGSRLDRRFAGVHRRIYLALALLILALAATGLALWSELRGLKANLAQARVEADTIRERLARLDEHRAPATTAGTRAATDQTPQLGAIDEKLDRNLAEGARAVQAIADHRVLLDKLAVKLDENLAETKRAVEETIVRAEPKLTSAPALARSFTSMALSDEERQKIRSFFGVRKKEDASSYDAKIGEIAPDTAPLYPVPSLLYNDVPPLKGHRFFADEVSSTIIIIRPLDNRVVAIV